MSRFIAVTRGARFGSQHGDQSYQIYIQHDHDDGYTRMGKLCHVTGTDEHEAAARIRANMERRASSCKSERLEGGHHPTECMCLMNFPVRLNEALDLCDTLNDLYGWEDN